MILIVLVQTTRNIASHTTSEYVKRLILINREIFLLLVGFSEIGTQLKSFCENV